MPLYPQEVHQDVALSNFSIGYRPAGFVASLLFPDVKVGKLSDKYYVWDKSDVFRRPVTRRSPTGSYPTVERRLSTDNFSCQEAGLEEPIPEDTLDNADDPIREEIANTEFITAKLLLDAEMRISDIALDTSNLTQYTTLTGADQWSDATSDPVAAINTGKTTIWKGCGQKPNLLIIGEPVFQALGKHPQVLDRIKYTQRGVVTEDLLAALFDIERVAVGRALKETIAEKKTQTSTLDWVWGKNAVMAYVNPSPALASMSLGYTFYGALKGNFRRIVERYYQQATRCWINRVRENVDEKLVAAGAGYLLVNAVA